MNAIVISDVHLGSRHCRRDAFDRFLDQLPAGVTLILNGDTVDYRYHRMRPDHLASLAHLAAESQRRPVVWVQGNHDEDYRPPEPGAIRFVPSYAIDRQLYVQHGFYFDHIMPYHRLFIFAFRLMHGLRVRLGAEPMHVAQYAKRWPRLYAVLRRNVLQNAVRYARANGFAAVTCGHTHYAEVDTVDGILYLNTGAWTETPSYAVVVGDSTVALHEIDSATDRVRPEPATFVKTAAK